MAAEYITSQIRQFPDASVHFTDLQLFHEKKLYHQLSKKLQEIITIPFFLANDTLCRLYEGFVRHVEDNLNQVEFVIFAIQASKQSESEEKAIEFLEKIAGKVKDADREAYLLCILERAHYELNINKLDECKERIDEAQEAINNYEGMSNLVHSAFYRICLQYHKAKANASEYYQSSLMYLSYTDFEDIPEQDRVTLASDLGLASLIGTKIYNFGELLQHPVLKVLEGTQYEWLGRLLFAFNSGDIDLFDQICQQQQDQEVLVQSSTFLQQKIRIMCLMEMVFRRASHDRNINFKEISETCRLPVVQVELLLMKAMSLGLIKGTIDEVDKVVQVKWVQGRILDLEQIAGMKDRLAIWTQNVDGNVKILEANLETPPGFS